MGPRVEDDETRRSELPGDVVEQRGDVFLDAQIQSARVGAATRLLDCHGDAAQSLEIARHHHGGEAVGGCSPRVTCADAFTDACDYRNI